MKPSVLFPADALLHHAAISDSGLSRALDDIESWGEWDGAQRQDLGATHVETIFDLLQIARMNPKVSMLYPQADAPWPIITVWRLDLSALGALNIPRFPGTDPNFIREFRAEVTAHLGEPYGWGAIGEAVGLGLLTRFVPFAGPALARQILKSPAVADKCGQHDCSVWLCDRVEAAVRKTYNMPAFELFEGNINEGRVRPADYPTSRFYKPAES